MTNALTNAQKPDSVFEQILEVIEIAEQLEFDQRNKVQQEDDQLSKKFINKPKKYENLAYKAYQQYFGKTDEE